MKKLFVITLVLGMVAAANATLTWSVDSVSIAVNESVTVQIASDTDNAAYAGGAAWVGQEPSTVAEITAILDLANAGTDAVFQTDTETGYDGWWTIDALDTTGDPLDTVLAGDQWDVTIKGLALGTYVISCDYYASAGVDDTLTINVIPEPMTVVLLGLGGLFLRRRR